MSKKKVEFVWAIVSRNDGTIIFMRQFYCMIKNIWDYMDVKERECYIVEKYKIMR